MSLWDLLPPELHEHIFKYTGRKSPLKPCFEDIKRFYYDPKVDYNTWPMPGCLERLHEQNVHVKSTRDKFGCIRYYRKIYSSVFKSLDRFTFVDITQAEIPDYYTFRRYIAHTMCK